MDQPSDNQSRIARKSSRFFTIFYLASGLSALGIGLFFGYQNWQLYILGTPGTGTVVDYEERETDDGLRYAAIFEYRVDGRLHRATADRATESPRYELGTTIPILINPDDPGDAQPNNPRDLFFAPVLMILVGLVLFAVNVVRLRQTESI